MYTYFILSAQLNAVVQSAQLNAAVQNRSVIYTGLSHQYIVLQKQNLQMQKFKEKERNSIVNTRNHNEDEYRCVANNSLGELVRSAPTFIQIAGNCDS